MTEEINQVFKDYRKVFLTREEELKAFLLRYWTHIFKKHEIEDLERLDCSDRIKLAGFFEPISGWRNIRDITLCSCEGSYSSQKRTDYKFKFKTDIIERRVVERVERPEEIAEEPAPEPETEVEAEDKPKEKEKKKEWKDFTEEEKEEYRKQKEIEKVETYEVFEEFIATQNLRDVMEAISSSKDFHSITNEALKIDDKLETIEDPVKKEKLEQLQKKSGYSMRNYLMVLSQARKREDAKFIGNISSYINWKRMGAQVMRNPDKSKPYGFKILMPVFRKRKTPEGGDFLKGFKLGTVFDISQTNKYDEFVQEREAAEERQQVQEEIPYKQAVTFTEQNFPHVLIKEDFSGAEKGTYNPDSNMITLSKETSHDLFHQLGYHIVHSELSIGAKEDESTLRNEILAEVTCYLLMKRFEEGEEYKTNYDFAYSNCWAFDILKEFKFREFEKKYNAILEHVKELTLNV